jgi:hypothetical protein
MTDAILRFPSHKKRTDFFNTSCLEKFGLSEKTINTETDCSIDGLKPNDLIRLIKFAKNKFGAEYHLSFGGKNLKDCSNHETKSGSLCGYCQYMEFG